MLVETKNLSGILKNLRNKSSCYTDKQKTVCLEKFSAILIVPRKKTHSTNHLTASAYRSVTKITCETHMIATTVSVLMLMYVTYSSSSR